MAKKWIIYDGQLLMSASVEFHVDILPKNYDKTKIQGGGRWEKPYAEDVVIFYGTSNDFWSADIATFRKAYTDTLLSEEITKHSYYFSPYEWYSDALKDYLSTKPNN